MNPSLTLIELVFLGSLVGLVGAVIVRLVEVMITFRGRVKLSSAPFWVMPLIGATAGLYLSFNRTYESVAQLQEDMRAVFSGVLVLIVLAVVIGIVRRVHQDREEQQEQDGINPYTENPVAFMASAPPPQHTPALFWLILAGVVSVAVSYFIQDSHHYSYAWLNNAAGWSFWELHALWALFSLTIVLVSALIAVVLRVFSEQAYGRLWLKITYFLTACFAVFSFF